jgi:hypothetical protein
MKAAAVFACSLALASSATARAVRRQDWSDASSAAVSYTPSSWADSPAPTSSQAAWSDSPAPSSTYNYWSYSSSAAVASQTAWDDQPAPSATPSSWQESPSPSIPFGLGPEIPPASASSWEDSPSGSIPFGLGPEIPPSSTSSSSNAAYTLYWNTLWDGNKVQHYSRYSDADGKVSVTIQVTDVLRFATIKGSVDEVSCVIKDVQGNQVRAFGAGEGVNSVRLAPGTAKQAVSITCELTN